MSGGQKTWKIRDIRRKQTQFNVTTYLPKELRKKFDAAKARSGAKTNSEYVRKLIEADL